MKPYRVDLSLDEFQFIRILIKVQRFNPDPVLIGLRKKFTIDEGES
ncbi:MAG: hypothetical protein MPEBLZ_04460 [Candidatus Methanoperedens nitroreducens]|uniref:Uncharacterized protein n=1 Tax=Candidatus Methanoperedens nitratireducens TaxID=1392998 RepID=A0A0N8KQ29_9EURY|nr:hypothetical protein [Candidatus Methanoperedens sp. BLZ2]KPQ40986.1 MAG: hypothetical protein MPEBLZ_04460 [Candidatus Methanoperedens sp. BLZ1]MBZ0176664.1 hypothetical protein [Candidatus Methanoperedens nitroreducens]MCX9080388.1 hypothetical protein [Candidatus Methanoperedens sp.]